MPGVANSTAAESMLWVLDSAASHSIIRPEAALALGATLVESSEIRSAYTATASAGEGLAQVNLGLVSIYGRPAGVFKPVLMAPPMECAGLLGLDVLRRSEPSPPITPHHPHHPHPPFPSTHTHTRFPGSAPPTLPSREKFSCGPRVG